MTNESTAVAVRSEMSVADYKREQWDLVRQVYAPDLNAAEFELYKAVAVETGLSPLARQIYAIARGTGDKRKITFQTGIDGFRLIAERTGERDGTAGPEWCDKDGNWSDIWLSETAPPFAARFTVFRKGHSQPYTAVARYAAYVQTTGKWEGPQGNRTKVGTEPTDFWKADKADRQLAKCAEAAAYRSAFPAEMHGLYTPDEMPEVGPKAEPRRQPQRASTQPRVAAPAANADGEIIEGEIVAPAEPAALEWWDDFKESVKAAGLQPSTIAEYMQRPLTSKNVAAYLAEHHIDWPALIARAGDAA